MGILGLIFVLFCNSVSAQYWEQFLDGIRFFGTPAEPLSGQVIYNRFSGKCLVYTHNTLKLADCAQQSEQRFEATVIKHASDIYTIRVAHTNQCLELGDTLQFAACTEHENQQILLRDSELDPFYKRIIFNQNGKCLDLFEQQKSVGTTLHPWTCHSGASGEFLLTKFKTKTVQVPKIVWTFWDKGVDKMPGFYQANLKHWKVVLGQEWEIRVVSLMENDKNYYKNWIDEKSIPSIDWIQDKIGNKPYEARLKGSVIFSDFVRLELLHKYGGVWMDPSNMLHHNFSKVLLPLENFGNFQVAGFTSKHQGTSELRYADSLENFFLVALPDSELIQEWKTNFRAYWDKKLPGMSLRQNPMFFDTNVSVIEYKNLRNYLNQHLALKYTLKYNRKLLSEILLLGEVGLEDDGPFSLLNLVNWDDSKLLKLSPKTIERFEHRLQDVLLFKFPSENSKHIRSKSEDYFFEPDNIFGRLNRIPAKNPTRSTRWTSDECTDYIGDTGKMVRIRNSEGTLCLAVYSNDNGGTYSLEPCNESKEQIFEKLDLSNGSISLRSVSSCKCMDIEFQSKKTAAKIHQWNCHTGTSQQLEFHKPDEGSKVQIYFEHSKLCLEAGKQVHQALCNPKNPNQEFIIEL